MKQPSQMELPELSNSLLWLMAVATGLIVANLYYNQPLLDAIASSYHVDSRKAAEVSILTQVGYATGMFFIAPLADRVKRKRLVLACLALAVVALLAAATAASIDFLILCSLFIGIFSLVPQLLVPMTAHLAKPAERGRKIGFVMSGLLIGILLSRTISGTVGHYFGWQTMFFIAAGLMVIIWLLLFFMLPEIEPDYQGKYLKLMTSLATLVREEPVLRIAAIRGALCFATFMSFWSTLVFLLRQNFGLGSDAAGYFGLVGIVGALAAGFMGRLSDRMDAYKLSTLTLLLILASFIIFLFSGHSIAGLIAGVILLDMGVQGTHISNQSLIFAIRPDARNRMNTVYMVTYFIGGSIGTYLTSLAWKYQQWTGVCIAGIVFSAVAVAHHLINQKNIQKARRGV